MGFGDELIAVRDAKHSRNHPFFEKWARGELTPEQTAIYCTQHYHYVSDYLDWMAYEASQVPHRDAKAFLYENLGDEENPDDRHLDMLKDYVGASGLPRDCVDDYRVLPSTEGLQNWGWRVVYQRRWQAALAAMFVGLESQFLGICEKVVPALREHYGYAPGAREIRFFEEHIEADALHGSKGLALVSSGKVLRHAGAPATGHRRGARRHGAPLALHERHLLVRPPRQGGRHPRRLVTSIRRNEA